MFCGFFRGYFTSIAAECKRRQQERTHYRDYWNQLHGRKDYIAGLQIPWNIKAPHFPYNLF
jgi:hypothetical protein